MRDVISKSRELGITEKRLSHGGQGSIKGGSLAKTEHIKSRKPGLLFL